MPEELISNPGDFFMKIPVKFLPGATVFFVDPYRGLVGRAEIRSVSIDVTKSAHQYEYKVGDNQRLYQPHQLFATPQEAFECIGIVEPQDEEANCHEEGSV